MPPWLPDTADRAFAGSKRAAGMLSASDGCAWRVPDHFLYPTPPTTKMAMVPVTQSHFGSLRFCWAAACCEVSSTASLVGDSGGLSSVRRSACAVLAGVSSRWEAKWSEVIQIHEFYVYTYYYTYS